MTMVESRTDEKLVSNLESPRFESGKPMLVAGLCGHFTTATWDSSPAQWQRLASYGKVPAQVGQAQYGLCFHTSNGIDYLSGIEVSSLTGLPPEFSSTNLPAQTYAVFPHREHVSKLRNTVGTIWHKWLPASGREVTQATAGAAAFFERYGAHFNPRTGLGDIEVWIPIKS